MGFPDADDLRAATFIRHVEIHDTLTSTNNRAAELARDAHIDLPTLVVARLQTAGRGRGQNIWWSADGALTFSVLLEPAALGIGAANWPQLSLAAAVAICDALSNELSPHDNPQSEIRNPKSPLRLGIKWPNDVMLDGRKVCGILIESPGGAAPAKDRLIVGIGINVNNTWRDAPRDAEGDGAALCDVTGHQHDLQSILIAVLTAFAVRVGQVQTGDSALPRAWQQLNMLHDKIVRVETNGCSIEGRCVTIESDGTLVVETGVGAQRLLSGSVRTP